MGINFYKKYIPTEQEIYELHELIDDHHWDMIREKMDLFTHNVHICKFSRGWQAHFDHNDGKYYTPQNIKEWIDNPAGIITDEYGKQYTPNEFWDEVEMHNREYINKQGDELNSYDRILECDMEKCRELYKIPVYNSYFNVNGLTFPVFSNFD